MPIDFSNYIDLTMFDEEPASIYADALDYARLSIPELTIRQGTPEDAVLQAVSYLSAINVQAINRLPNRLMAGIMSLLGLPVDDGTRAVIEVEFTAFDNNGVTIPAGTLIRYDYDLLEPPVSVQFQTTEALSIAAVDPGDPLPTGIVEARAVLVGVLLPIPTTSPENTMSMETTNTGVLSVTYESLVTEGSNPETDTEYLTRAARYVASLSSGFCKASQIEAYIQATYSNISRVKVYDLTDSTGALELDDAAEPGYITIFVYGVGAPASSDLKTEIQTDITDRTVAGLNIGVLDVVEAELSVTVNAGYFSSYAETDVEEAITQAIINAVSLEQSPFGTKLRQSIIYAELAALESIAYVDSVTLVAEDANSTITSGDAVYTDKGVLAYIPTTGITFNLTAVD
jgi:hypothetical protein